MFHNLKSHRTLDNSTSELTLNKIEILNQNILYITHQIDACLKKVNQIDHDLGLQTQVDQYFKEKEDAPPQ